MNHMERAFAPALAKYSADVLKATWGHLAPRRHKAYRGYVTFAVGCFGNDPLNPTVLECEIGLDSSPWFFDALTDFVQSVGGEEGGVYRWDGEFKNYEFNGTVQRMKVSRPDAIAAPAVGDVPGEAVRLTCDIAAQIQQKLKVIAQAFPGDKQTRDTLIPAVTKALAHPTQHAPEPDTRAAEAGDSYARRVLDAWLRENHMEPGFGPWFDQALQRMQRAIEDAAQAAPSVYDRIGKAYQQGYEDGHALRISDAAEDTAAPGDAVTQDIVPMDSDLFAQRTPDFGVVRVSRWPDGLVVWVGGEIRWKSWKRPGCAGAAMTAPDPRVEAAARAIWLSDSNDGLDWERIDGGIQDAYRRAACAVLAAADAAAPSGWRSDMENAPRDGTSVLGWGWSTGCEDDEPLAAVIFFRPPVWISDTPWARFTPTHWMPLPPAPGQDGESGR